MRVDLHMHSNNSDGSDSVETIIDRAVRRGMEVISITDHDNANGLKRAREYAKGKIGFINGIELSAYDKIEIHILGYGIDYENANLKNKTEELLSQRVTRIKKILAKLRESKIYISEFEINFDCAGRLQIAKLMVAKKYVSSVSEAFNKYLGVNGSAYLPSNRLSPVDAVKMIVGAGGSPVIAHPEKYLHSGILEDMIDELKPHGLVGLECHYPSHSVEVEGKLVEIARKKGLIETVGCDYHGTNGINEIGQVKAEMSMENLVRLNGGPIL